MNEKELKRIINILWGYMGVVEIRQLEGDNPELIDILRRIHIEVDHPETKLCDDCMEDAAWVRKTQFSGKHHFCTTHAEEQIDFGSSDPSYFVWEKLN